MEDRSARGGASLRPTRRHGIVLVGTGFIAESHIASIQSRTDVDLVGVVDVDAGRAATAALRAGAVQWTTDLDEALRWDAVDAAICCTPNDTHRPIGLAVAAAGKHLLVEKPLATTTEAAVEMAVAFESADRVLMAGHTHRFYDYGRDVKSAIASGAIGSPVLIRLALLGGWIWPDWGAWMLDPARSGGHALHNGVHLLDLVSWWIGEEPVAVYARGSKQTSAELSVYDYLEMVVSYSEGRSAICEMSRGHRPRDLSQRDVLVIGTEGTLALPRTANASTVVTQHGTELVPGIAGNGFRRQLAAFLAAIDGAPPAVSVADAVRAVSLGVAAEQSMASGHPVPVAVSDRSRPGVDRAGSSA